MTNFDILRSGVCTTITGAGKPFIAIRFKTTADMHCGFDALMDLMTAELKRITEQTEPATTAKDATYVFSLRADSGYSAKSGGRISADQYGRICKIMNEPDGIDTPIDKNTVIGVEIVNATHDYGVEVQP